MSGTSLDGLDIAYCQFDYDGKSWNYKIIEATTINYDKYWLKILTNVISYSGIELLTIHTEYGKWLGQQCKNFIEKQNISVDFISSHGHTVFHQPEKGITYQIGCGQHIASTSGYKVICDFRTKDISLSGQGAPLVPIGDELLFKEYDFCLNLGGFSNISFRQNEERIAFDISPVNIALNYLCQKIHISYDDKGTIASSGRLNLNLLGKLEQLPFYSQKPPKSLGYEWFESSIIPLLEDTNDRVENLLHTCVIHISKRLSSAIKSYSTTKKSKVLITGGGAKNDFLVDCIQKELGEDHKLEIPEDTIIDYKEAIIFGFLGVLKSRNEVNCLKSVTGATSDSSTGVIYYP